MIRPTLDRVRDGVAREVRSLRAAPPGDEEHRGAARLLARLPSSPDDPAADRDVSRLSMALAVLAYGEEGVSWGGWHFRATARGLEEQPEAGDGEGAS